MLGKSAFSESRDDTEEDLNRAGFAGDSLVSATDYGRKKRKIQEVGG